MKTTTLVSAMALLAIAGASCSSGHPDSPDNPASGKAIRFAAQAPNPSRAATTTATLDEFSVYAFAPGDSANNDPYMADVLVTKNSNNQWTYSPTQYWPYYPLNFFAFSPSTWGDGTEPGHPVEYYNQNGWTDLLYSVAMNQSQGNGPVTFNFKHALSQININLRTDSAANFDIAIQSVYVNGIATKGTFNFPRTTTTPAATTGGTWSNLSGENVYIAYMSGDVKPSECLQLTSDYQNVNQASPLFLLPQPLGIMKIDQEAVTGEYIKIILGIFDRESGRLLWPNSETPKSMVAQAEKFLTLNNELAPAGVLSFPLLYENVSQWNPGTKYLYNITVNMPHGLEGIEFGSPTVDTYSSVEVNPEATY